MAPVFTFEPPASNIIVPLLNTGFLITGTSVPEASDDILDCPPPKKLVIEYVKLLPLSVETVSSKVVASAGTDPTILAGSLVISSGSGIGSPSAGAGTR